jgi:hypothetical protein
MRAQLVRRPAGSLARRSDGLAGTRAPFEIERLQRNGLVSSNGDRELLAKREAVELALAVWRASREQTSAAAPLRARHANVVAGVRSGTKPGPCPHIPRRSASEASPRRSASARPFEIDAELIEIARGY